mmetsp:Transcript_51993/g.134090  ORF Transcript_51993/g.134090 Transcript_51993/m.134090 type:complete len:220 (+) Transcript_51993:198-857(+)
MRQRLSASATARLLLQRLHVSISFLHRAGLHLLHQHAGHAAARHEAAIMVELGRLVVVEGIDPHPARAGMRELHVAVLHAVRALTEVVQEHPSMPAGEDEAVRVRHLHLRLRGVELVLLANMVEHCQPHVERRVLLPAILPQRVALALLAHLGAVVYGGRALREHVPGDVVHNLRHVAVTDVGQPCHVVVVDLVAEGVQVPVEAALYLLGHALAQPREV